MMHDWQEIPLQNGELRLHEGFLGAVEADALLEHMQARPDWRRDRVRVFGREHPIPRLHQWYGDAGVRYRWSGLTMQAIGWPRALAALRDRLHAETGAGFNAALANLYRDGRDSMGWHADDEAELGPRPVIASVSLGAERDFVLRPRPGTSAAGDDGRNTVKLRLPHGSLLLMSGDTQTHWQHALPKRLRVSEPRVNLTFRYILPAAGAY